MNVSTAKSCSRTGKNVDERFHQRQTTDEVKAATSTQIFSITRQIKAKRHTMIHYPCLLITGWGSWNTDAATSHQQPENHFYQAALSLLEASQKHILRYAELVETMAASCTDAQRCERLRLLRRSPAITRNISRQTFWQACQLFW
ncbi:pyruvate formate lyase family protein [Escherichia coli]